MSAESGKTLIVSVPWPARLFGDLQYSLGLPAITVALDMRTVVGATPRADGRCTVKAPWIPAPLPFDPREPAEVRPHTPSLANVLGVMRSEKMELPGGFDFQVLSRAPVSHPLADSPVLAAAWTIAFLSLDGRLEKLSGSETAELACRACRDETSRSARMPEVYTCVLGGTLFVQPNPPSHVASMDRTLPGIVICCAGERAPEPNRWRQAAADTLAALEKISGLFPAFNLRETPADDVIPRLRELPDRDAGIVYAHLATRDLCRQAFELLESEYAVDDDRLAEMVDKQHEMLRDYLGFNVPEIETLIAAAVSGGALGCKIVLGVDGFLAFAPGSEKSVISSVKKAGGEAYMAATADGMRVEALSADRLAGLK